MRPGAARWGRWVGLLVALCVTVPGALHPFGGGLLDGVNLVFHEAGHVLFSLFGGTVMLLGGSAMQVLVPAACAGVFLWRRDRYSAGLVSLWTGQSLAGVSAYMRDAPTRALDLITGDPDTHDWWQLLDGAGALPLAAPLANLTAFLAFAVMLVGVVLALWDEVR